MAGGKALTKVVYKPDTQSTDEYIAIVNPDEYKKWKEGDTTIPLVEVVDSFTIFHSGQGNQGILGKASKQQLETVFGSSHEVDSMKFLLEKGVAQAGEGISDKQFQKNLAQGSKFIDTRGSGKHTSGV